MQQDEQATVGKLVLSAGNRILREVLIDRKRLTIGRRPYNDLLLDDLTVSGEHAIVHTVKGDSVIHDLKSRNGTLINGAPVMQQQLADGDCVDADDRVTPDMDEVWYDGIDQDCDGNDTDRDLDGFVVGERWLDPAALVVRHAGVHLDLDPRVVQLVLLAGEAHPEVMCAVRGLGGKRQADQELRAVFTVV